MAEAPVLEDTERTTGRVALRKNIAAAMALSGAVRSTLGPKGLDKLLLDDEGRTLVTNDGVTVLETARVEHPVARMLIDASSAQDRAARDGTTSAVVIAAELLRNAWHLVLQGVHPSTIVRGYRMAESEAMAHLEELAFEGSEEDLTTAVRSSLAGKASRAVQDRLADLAMEAAMCVERTVDGVFEVDPTRVSTVMAVGRPATDSEIVEGLVLQKRRAHPDMVKLVENGTIALLDGGLERRKMRGDVTFQATTPTSWTPSAAVKSNACWTTSRRSRPLVWTSWPSQEPLTTRRTGACLTLASKPSAGCWERSGRARSRHRRYGAPPRGCTARRRLWTRARKPLAHAWGPSSLDRARGRSCSDAHRTRQRR